MAMQESPGRPGVRTPRTDEYADVAGRVTWIGDQDTDGDMRLWAALNSLTEMSELAISELEPYKGSVRGARILPRQSSLLVSGRGFDPRNSDICKLKHRTKQAETC